VVGKNKFEHTKGVIEGQTMQWPNKKGTKGKTMIYKTIHRN